MLLLDLRSYTTRFDLDSPPMYLPISMTNHRQLTNVQLSGFSMRLWGSSLIHISFHLLLFHCRQDCDSALFISESQRRMCQEWASEHICTYTMWMLWRFYEPWLFRLIYFSDARHTSRMQFIDWLLKHALAQIKVSAWRQLSHNQSSLTVCIISMVIYMDFWCF